MPKLNDTILELNRRLLHRQPAADFGDVMASEWFADTTYSKNHKGRLRLLARSCRIARCLYAENPSERRLLAKRSAFQELGWEAGAILYTASNGSDKPPLAIRCLASFLSEAKRDPLLVNVAYDILQASQTGPFGFPIEAGDIRLALTCNISEPRRVSGWDHSIRPHMLAMASLVSAAPTPELTSLLARRALSCAAASVAACQDLVETSQPERWGGEGLFRSRREFGGKSLVQHVADSVTATVDNVMDAYGFDGFMMGCPEVRRAMHLKASASTLLHMAKPKLDAMQVTEAERHARLKATVNPRRPQPAGSSPATPAVN